MIPERKSQIDAAPFAPRPAARPIEQELGGQVGQWHALLNEQFGAARPVNPADAFISGTSRLAGPAIFVATLAALIYALKSAF